MAPLAVSGSGVLGPLDCTETDLTARFPLASIVQPVPLVTIGLAENVFTSFSRATFSDRASSAIDATGNTCAALNTFDSLRRATFSDNASSAMEATGNVTGPALTVMPPAKLASPVTPSVPPMVTGPAEKVAAPSTVSDPTWAGPGVRAGTTPTRFDMMNGPPVFGTTIVYVNGLLSCGPKNSWTLSAVPAGFVILEFGGIEAV